MPDVRLKNTLKNIVKPSNNLVFNIGDYFRMYKSKYYVYILEIIPNQRNYEDGYGEYITTLMRVNIYDKEENLLADNVIVPVDNIINGKLSYYIPCSAVNAMQEKRGQSARRQFFEFFLRLLYKGEVRIVR